MDEIFLFYEKDSEDIKDLCNVLTTNYSLKIRTDFDTLNAVNATNLVVFCLTNQFVKSENCMKALESRIASKKRFFIVKLEDILTRTVKLNAILFDDKKCYDFSKDREKRTSLLYHSRFQDFIKAIRNQLGNDLNIKFKAS